MSWLIDTNIISEWMRKEPHPSVVEWGKQQEAFDFSVISLEEVRFGLARQNLAQKLKWFDTFVNERCRIREVTPEIASQAGLWRGQFNRKGVTHTQADMLIAATAWRWNLTVVTRNTGDFDGCGIPLLNPFVST